MAARTVVTLLRGGHGHRVARDRRRPLRRRALALLILSGVAVAAIGALTVAESHNAKQAQTTRTAPRSAGESNRPLRAQVTLATGSRPVRVPDSFLGLSTEYWAVPEWEQEGLVLNRVLSLLHVPGDGPLVLRIGGDSANEALWESEVGEFPDWVVELTPTWLKQTGALVRSAHVRLILDLNLVTASPAISAEWAGAAEAALPRGSIAGFEIGNEPDLYSRKVWIRIVWDTIAASQLLPHSLSPADYASDFGAYARTVGAVAPGVPLLGPAVAYPVSGIGWISTLLSRGHAGLTEVTAHEYPYSACAKPASSHYPTIARLLSEAATAGMARRLIPAIRLAHDAGLPFRLTELNSVTCGGRPGVSNTFATALWAPDALFELLRAGVDAVDVHVNPGKSNAAFSLSSRGLSANPLLYGLILFARTLGPDAALVPVHVAGSAALRLKAWAVRVRPGGLHVLLINKGPRDVTTTLHLPGFGPASIGRLLAPSVTSHTGITLGGQHLTTHGAWLGSPSTEVIAPAAGSYEVTVPAFSAALVEASPA
ncbi:MAG TPA: glycosyl hydrolase family 79 C-terminal domain-containing protein [Solirubrobacteraceae bacterium]|nr:glycosyl hydrolase family 79 C-terminal domain-containing protein [Solirubrobacteraceae bacterium]